jgi:hypothetical protein
MRSEENLIADANKGSQASEQGTNERTNERTNKRINERTNERTNVLRGLDVEAEDGLRKARAPRRRLRLHLDAQDRQRQRHQLGAGSWVTRLQAARVGGQRRVQLPQGRGELLLGDVVAACPGDLTIIGILRWMIR